MLKALGYSEKANKYAAANPFSFATKITLIKKGEYTKKSKFIKADLVVLTSRALTLKIKGENKTLSDKLNLRGIVYPEPTTIEPTITPVPVTPEPTVIPTPTVEPTPTVVPTPTYGPIPVVTGPTNGTGDKRNAGVFNTPDDKLVVINKADSYETNFNKVNVYVI